MTPDFRVTVTSWSFASVTSCMPTVAAARDLRDALAGVLQPLLVPRRLVPRLLDEHVDLRQLGVQARDVGRRCGR